MSSIVVQGFGSVLLVTEGYTSQTAPLPPVAPCSRPAFVLRAVNLNPPPAITLGGVCVIDNTEAITYYSRTGESTYASPGAAVPNALRRAATRDQLQSPALLGKTALVWHVWAAQIPGIVPKLRDRITDIAGFNWQVISVDVQTFSTRYRLTCVREH